LLPLSVWTSSIAQNLFSPRSFSHRRHLSSLAPSSPIIEPAMPRKKKDEKKKDENNEEKERPYFSWNDELDQILVNSMMMLVESRKIDSKGKFVAGSYLLLEDMIERAKPGCGVKADPNIMSRVKTLKQKFLAVQELRGLSGAGWDETLKMVILDDHVFAEYVQNHKHCAKLNKVSFPCYDGLEFLYGKARANGAGAVGLSSCVRKCRVRQSRYPTTYCWDGSQLNLINQRNQLGCRTKKQSLWLLIMMSPRQHRPIKHNNPTLQAVQKRFDVQLKVHLLLMRATN
ncbi:hypothetical protein LINGRAHAP2_LOCUS13927, partial [Linum grandiflorum]